MKNFLILIVMITCLIIQSVLAQEVEVTLSGNTTAQGFSVLDNSSNNLFRVRGDGSVGVGTATPAGIFDIIGDTITSGDGKGINIYAQSTDDPIGDGGNINITSGNALDGGTSGDINIKTARDNSPYHTTNTGDINIGCGWGDGTGGDVTIYAGGNQGAGGGAIKFTGAKYVNGRIVGGMVEIWGGGSFDDGQGGAVNIISGDGGSLSGGAPAGDISLTCGWSELQPGANIDLTAGESTFANGGHVNIAAGESDVANGGDVNIKGGTSQFSEGDGGNIILTPGSGETDGLVIVNGSGTYSGTWTQSSDERFKKNIEPLRNSIDKIEQLNGVSYELRKEEFPEKNFSNRKQIGLIAQDVEKVLPELVRTDSEGYKSVAYQNMVPVLIEAIKEQQDEIEDLNNRIIKLERMIYSDVKLVKNEE
ncbi:MAG: tail fiber domain-containing protein [Deltaproteobacteria bacterium]|nr:tail fiber domain-containing protein [Deltaproteobacteria bacterium]